MSSSIQSLYKIYEIFNDFNRIRILVSLNKCEKTVEEICKHVDLSETTVSSQLEYLKKYNIISQITDEKSISFKIKDRNLSKIVNNISNYVK